MFKKNREDLLKIIKERYSNYYLPQNSIILMKGSYNINSWDLDVFYQLKHETNFFYAFGCNLPNFYGFIETKSGRAGLIIPTPKDEDDAIFNKYFTEKEILKRFDIDYAIKDINFNNFINERNIRNILISDGLERGKKSIDAMDLINKLKIKNINIDRYFLYSSLNEARCIKNEEECEKMKIANEISSKAHIAVMRGIKKLEYEYNIQALFYKNCEDCEDYAYSPICCAGGNGSILHYMVNNCKLKNGDFLLWDMGITKDGYTADITCSYPYNGVFTEKQKEIYNIVLRSHDNARDILKEGVHYSELTTISLKTILKGLMDLNIVINGDLDELFNKRLYLIFMFHGLGHYIGARVHDTGLRKENSSPDDLEFKNNEQYRSITVENCKENMFCTIEPGIYFNDISLKNNEHLHQYIDLELFEEYKKEIGGIRIEDVYRITKDGYQEVSNCPRTPKQIEACIAGKDWEKFDRNDY